MSAVLLREFEVRFVGVVPSPQRLTIRLDISSGGVRVRPVEAVVRVSELELSGRSNVESALLHALCVDAAHRAELVIRCSARSLDAPMQVHPWVHAALDDEAKYRARGAIDPGSVVHRFVAAPPRSK